ncbi:hypothetical protein OIU77_004601 [Salix suchowensis]|uniref:F-box domain-containing protein n=1 Tax=Salix suchowensis TaxID=1278906 RepID=A0ABQ9AUX9_9ROSI|nr:hypothetical protein OIU77_004601 [Salix suchowensis]
MLQLVVSSSNDEMEFIFSNENGSQRRLRLANLVAVTDIQAMLAGRDYFRGLEGILCKTTERNYFKSRTSRMEYVSDCTKYRKSSAITSQVICGATFFMPWSLKIPIASQITNDIGSSILPGLPDDVAKYCLALVPRSHFPTMGSVCKKWRSFLKSKELITIRKLAGLLEEWLYVLTMDSDAKESHWEVLDCFGHKHQLLPPMPGPVKAEFGVVVLYGKLLVMAGYSVIDGTASASADVYEYDSCLNSWRKLASMNVARYEFACAEVNGKVYVVGGYGDGW